MHTLDLKTKGQRANPTCGEQPGVAAVADETALWLRLSAHLNSDLVHCAYALARRVHAGHSRDEGTPYILHPLRVALILAEECHIGDPEVIAAALLHDVIEDSARANQPALAAADLEREFGARVARMVALLTKETAPPEHKLQRDEAYYARIAAAAADTRRLKCADRLDNLRHIHLSPEPGKAERYKQQTRRHELLIARETDPYLYQQLLNLLEGKSE